MSNPIRATLKFKKEKNTLLMK